jgi:hypothetical protein
MTDAQVFEAQLAENLQRRDVPPMEGAQGFKALLDLEKPKYSIEQKVGKTPALLASRLKLTDLVPTAVEPLHPSAVSSQPHLSQTRCAEDLHPKVKTLLPLVANPCLDALTFGRPSTSRPHFRSRRPGPLQPRAQEVPPP